MNKIYKKLASNHILSLISYPPYLSFSASVFASQTASNMLTIVLIFLIFHLTSSNFSVSILLFTVLIPQIFISFLGGVIADTFNKKLILVLGNLLRAVVLLILFFNFKSVYLVYFVTLVISVITQFYVPAESPLIPSLVGREKLVAANSIFGISFFGSVLIGYVLAGPAVRILGRMDVFLLLSGFFVAAAVFAALIPEKKIIKKAPVINTDYIRKSLKMEFTESLSLVRKSKQINDAFFLLIFSQIIIFLLATLIPGYAKTILQVAAEDLSIILFAPAAIGMVLSALLIGSVFNKVTKEKLMSAGIFISGIVLFLFPFTSRIFAHAIINDINAALPKIINLNVFNFVLLLAFFAGFANALIFIPSQAVIQEVVPEEYRSKVYGLLFSLIGLFSLVPIMIAGGIADVFGVGTVLLIMGASVLILGAIREKLTVSVVNFLVRKK